MFDDLSGNTKESNIDDTYLSSCRETLKEPEKKLYLKNKKTQTHSWWTRENGIATFAMK